MCQGKGDEGAVVATLRAMEEDHAVEIARRIVDLECRLRTESYNQRLKAIRRGSHSP